MASNIFHMKSKVSNPFVHSSEGNLVKGKGGDIYMRLVLSNVLKVSSAMTENTLTTLWSVCYLF